MPIYEYRCESCGHQMDALQKMSDPDLTDCPECEESALKKLISAVGFRLKGGGWYETDFKNGNEKKRNLAEGGGSKDGDAKGGSDKKDAAKSSDTKTENKKSKPADKTPVSKKAVNA